MIEPPIGELLEKVDCRYSLAVITAKRARQLVDGAHPRTRHEGKAVTLASYEIHEGKVTYSHPNK